MGGTTLLYVCFISYWDKLDIQNYSSSFTTLKFFVLANRFIASL
jgi:hypothetical protein